MWPEVRAFNTVLVGACVMDEFLIGAGVMGIIERMFSDIAGWIGEQVVSHGWISAEKLIHYNLHEYLDILNLRPISVMCFVRHGRLMSKIDTTLNRDYALVRLQFAL